MLITQDQAKQMRCCGPDGCGEYNAKAVNGAKRRYCIASKCMAWRWDMAWSSSTEEGQGGDLVLRLKRREGEPKLGYCGYAGVPYP